MLNQSENLHTKHRQPCTPQEETRTVKIDQDVPWYIDQYTEFVHEALPQDLSQLCVLHVQCWWIYRISDQMSVIYWAEINMLRETLVPGEIGFFVLCDMYEYVEPCTVFCARRVVYRAPGPPPWWLRPGIAGPCGGAISGGPDGPAVSWRLYTHHIHPA